MSRGERMNVQSKIEIDLRKVDTKFRKDISPRRKTGFHVQIQLAFLLLSVSQFDNFKNSGKKRQNRSHCKSHRRFYTPQKKKLIFLLFFIRQFILMKCRVCVLFAFTPHFILYAH